MKREGGEDSNLYCFNVPAERDWTYWDAAARNPSPLARDLWMIPSGNAAALLAGRDGGSGPELVVLSREESGDVNLYLYNSPAAADWTYWDAAARNPSPLARDFWFIPAGNSAAGLASVDITGDGAGELAILAAETPYAPVIRYYNAPSPGDWTYWDAAARNPSPLARDLWTLPPVEDVAALTSVALEGAGEKLALLGGGADLNLYLLEALRPGDWSYWDARARNPSPLARDFWVIPAGNDAVGISAANADGLGPGDLAVVKRSGEDSNLYCFRSPLPGDWSYWDAYYRNPVALARDFWIIPSGNEAVAVAAARLR